MANEFGLQLNDCFTLIDVTIERKCWIKWCGERVEMEIKTFDLKILLFSYNDKLNYLETVKMVALLWHLK